MKIGVKTGAMIGTWLLCLVPSEALAVPVSNLTAVTAVITRDFSSVDEIRTVHLPDDPDDQLDFIIIGGSRHGGFKVEVLRLEHRRVTERWNSDLTMRDVEFERSGPVNVYTNNEDYEVVVEGCAQHMCHDGISGFWCSPAKRGNHTRQNWLHGVLIDHQRICRGTR